MNQPQSTEEDPVLLVRLPAIVHKPIAGRLPDGRYGLRLGDATLQVSRTQWDNLYWDGKAAFDVADNHAYLLNGTLPRASA